jgi:hypothetical protein
MDTMKFVTRPSWTTEQVVVTKYRRELTADIAFVGGILPIVIPRVVSHPIDTQTFEGRRSPQLFKVTNWPYPLGEKQREVTIEDLTLLGVFAVKQTGNEFECSFDADKPGG